VILLEQSSLYSAFNPLRNPLLLAEPAWPLQGTEWLTHVPFAFYLIGLLQPALVVELSPRLGNSYCAFCQSAQLAALPTRCLAFFDYPEVVAESAPLLAHHDQHFSSFSRWQRRDYTQLPTDVADHTIDLLHLDNSHGAEALQRDFAAWLPKLSRQSAVLISNISSTPRNQSICTVWQDLKLQFPHFEFEHAEGLGILATGPAIPPALRFLCEASAMEAAALRTLFRQLGQGLQHPAPQQESAPQLQLLFGRFAQQRITELQQRVAELEQTNSHLTEQVTQAQQHVTLAHQHLEQAQQQLTQMNDQLVQLTQSRAYKMVERVWHLRQLLSGQKAAPIAHIPPLPLPSPPADEPWVARHTCAATELAEQRVLGQTFNYRPHFSILTPVYRTPPAILRATLESVLQQSYEQWDLCLVAAADESQEVRQVLEQAAVCDSRVRLHWLPQNLGIAANTNAALQLATGDFVVLLDHDDELAPQALFAYAQRLNEEASLDILYSDEDKLDQQNQRCHPFFKPDWSPEYLRGVMYVGHLLCVRRSLVNEAGGWLSRFDGVQDFELMLRLSERTQRIAHVPQILYHWRQVPGSIALDGQAKDNIGALQCFAVNEHLQRLQLPARAESASSQHQVRLVPHLPSAPEAVSIIVAHQGEELPDMLAQLTNYPNYELIVVSRAPLNVHNERVQCLTLTLPGTFSLPRAYNLGAKFAQSKHLVFLDSAFTVESPYWLTSLVYYSAQSDVGAVGGLLLSASGKVENAGFVIGGQAGAAALLRSCDTATGGYAGSLVCAREVSAVAGPCLALQRERFEAAGGFNEHFQAHFYDVDLCLRLRATGQRIVFTPTAQLQRRNESAVEPDAVDQALLWDLHRPQLERGDPYYNPNFDPLRSDYTVRL
jgi:O-antigen biosynthesis protein